ncbi:MAG: PIG-L family deacetylase [Thermoanaerobaculaceae bacterium]|nr:PIG-L family deacetylase [Thermoanaerobaculaceae bacterium]TAM49020.1 MAG: PIG-L family deacetylase [Acidobacteriota bacterium]
MTRARFPVESDLIPYAASVPPGSRWLVLAPHPDDEVFGVGATVALAVARGVEVRVVIATDGGAQGEPAEREGAAAAAAAALGVPPPEFWRLADRSLHQAGAALRRRLAEAFARLVPDVVFVPSPVELHPDHRALALAVQRAVRAATLGGLRERPPRWVAAYEVSAPLAPNFLVAADGGWEAKRRAGACYAAQLAFRRYGEVAEALAVLRALTLDGATRAEALHLLPARRVARLSSRRWAARMGAVPAPAAR